MKNNKGVTPILIVLIIVGVLALGGGTYYFLVNKAPKSVGCTQEAKICPDGSTVGRTGSNCEFAECPAAKADETASWKVYNSEQEIMGFSLDVPPEWKVNYKEEVTSWGALVRVWFDFAPLNWDTSYGIGWMGWGAFSFDVYEPQDDISQWIEKYLPDLKDSLTITVEDPIGGKPVFGLNKGEGWNEEELGMVWVPRYVIFGIEYSYDYGFSQDGANNFVQIIKEKIFPNVSIK